MRSHPRSSQWCEKEVQEIPVRPSGATANFVELKELASPSERKRQDSNEVQKMSDFVGALIARSQPYIPFFWA